MQLIVPLQHELPLRVPVCAWCKPKKGGVELGASLGAISHGICPRHLKQLQLEMAKDLGDPGPAVPMRARRRKGVFQHPELNY